MEKIDFICPICQGEEYEIHCTDEKNVLTLPSKAKIDYYECKNCSVHFSDPNKFNIIEEITNVANKVILEVINQ